MNVKLSSADAWGSKDHVVVTRLPAVLGRSPEADICVQDRWASRRHCVLDEIEGTLVVRDLQSKHGTIVNGDSVGETPLTPGDKLTVGTTTFVVHYRPAARPRLSRAECETSERI